MPTKLFKRAEIYFIDNSLHKIVNNPDYSVIKDGCYRIYTLDNNIRIYPLTSVKEIVEIWEWDIKDKPEGMEYGNK